MVWTAPQVGRSDPPLVGDERTMLQARLDYQRQTLLYKCRGLSGEELRRQASPPSSLSLLGLVRHMSEVERSWFRRWIGGDDVAFLYSSEADPDGEFDHVDLADAAADFATFREELVLADAAHGRSFAGRHLVSRVSEDRDERTRGVQPLDRGVRATQRSCRSLTRTDRGPDGFLTWESRVGPEDCWVGSGVGHPHTPLHR